MAFNRILSATDFSADAGAALRRAVLLASQHKASLEVLHVVPQESLQSLRQWVPVECADRIVVAVREELEGCAVGAAKHTGMRIDTRATVGRVIDTILERAAASDLVVIGAHGTNPLKDMVLGTTAERIAGRSPAPVLVVRAPPAQPYSKVLVAVDLLPGAEEALALALGFAPAATLVAVHAFDIPFGGMLHRAGVTQPVIDQHRVRAHRDALDRLAALSRSVSGAADRFLAYAERGHPATVILERQQAIGADLVVIRKRARSLAEAVFLGSVTRHVLADAASDVLVLAEPKR